VIGGNYSNEWIETCLSATRPILDDPALSTTDRCSDNHPRSLLRIPWSTDGPDAINP
jgi:hypothetical protein